MYMFGAVYLKILKYAEKSISKTDTLVHMYGPIPPLSPPSSPHLSVVGGGGSCGEQPGLLFHPPSSHLTGGREAAVCLDSKAFTLISLFNYR